MLWCVTDVVFLNIRKQSIHPGIHVAIDLIVVVGLMSAAITQLVLSATYWNYPYESYLNPTCYAAVIMTIITRYFFPRPIRLLWRNTDNQHSIVYSTLPSSFGLASTPIACVKLEVVGSHKLHAIIPRELRCQISRVWMPMRFHRAWCSYPSRRWRCCIRNNNNQFTRSNTTPRSRQEA